MCPHLQLGVEHLAEAGGEAAEVAVPLLHLRLQTPLELAAEELLLAGEVDDALLHPRELRRQELLELGALGVDRRVGAAKYISIFIKLFVQTTHPIGHDGESKSCPPKMYSHSRTARKLTAAVKIILWRYVQCGWSLHGTARYVMSRYSVDTVDSLDIIYTQISDPRQCLVYSRHHRDTVLLESWEGKVQSTN